MSDTKELPALQRWLNSEISAGKFCELIGVPRHVGEYQILHPVFLLKEKLKKSRQHNACQNQALERANRAIKLMNAAHKALMIERDRLLEKLSK